MGKYKQIGTAEVQTFLDHPENGSIMDIRPTAAFNGWKLQDESRGGHIPGAKSIPLQWTRQKQWRSNLRDFLFVLR